jgi:asparagine synthase (glutamine-hydrolysing)
MLLKISVSYGFAWTIRRAWYEVKVKSGFQKLRFRRRPWGHNELARWLPSGFASDPEAYRKFWQQHRPQFFFNPSDSATYVAPMKKVLGTAGVRSLIEEAENIRDGRCRYFFSKFGDLGTPTNWHRNPFTGQITSPKDHWSRILVHSATVGDIKFIWEPGRFASAYTLARAYWLTGNIAYVETFWQLIESWRDANPPNHGAHWKCGQEISFRLMAWCFAMYAFADAPATTPERLAMLVGMIGAQAERVEGDHIYAYLQGNNHAISEGVGLWTVGLLFPEMKMSEKWVETGRNILEAEAKRQIHEDGAYVQKSFNYHRLMLHDFLWAIRLGEVTGHTLSFSLYGRVQRAYDFLYQMQDESSGFTPNFGANDGALILPLNQCDYRDFRPILGCLNYHFKGVCLNNSGPWDEDLLWLYGPSALEAPREKIPRSSFAAARGGYYTLRDNHSWAMIRCAALKERPVQADMLHLDIWRNGVNIACDAGSYLYYAPPPWCNTLASTKVHNTLTIDGLDQMERGPRFLWLNWSQAHACAFRTGHQLAYFEGEHNGYRRLPDPVTHRRAVLKAGRDTWLVIDDVVGADIHDFDLSWLLVDVPFRTEIQEQHLSLAIGTDYYDLWLRWCGPEGNRTTFAVTRGSDVQVPRGWHSLYYGVLQPAIAALFRVHGKAPCRFISLFAPSNSSANLDVTNERIIWSTEDEELEVMMSPPGESRILLQACMRTQDGIDRMSFDGERRK